ncbi:MAG: CsgG/HfaB family protein [Candidatus Acidiferrales bacterium]
MRPLGQLRIARSAATTMLFCALIALICSSAAAQDAATKKRIAIFNFDNGTPGAGANPYAAIFGTSADQDVGRGISAMLIVKLVQDGKYTVIERAELDKILSEQNFSNSDRADATTAAKIGRLLGVDAIILGTVTRFGPDDKHSTSGGGTMFGRGGMKTVKSKAVVGISSRVVNVTTGEIITAFTGTGESAKAGDITHFTGRGMGGFDMVGSDFTNSLLGEATRNAVNDMAAQLDSLADKIPILNISIDGLVADVSGSTLIINVGKTAGVKLGDKLEISRDVRAITDPATGKVLTSVADHLGIATVTQVADNFSTATFSGTGAVQVGDRARSAQ